MIGSALFPLNLVIPIVMMCLSGSTPFVKSQAKESLNFQISVVIWAIISLVACLIVVGIFMFIALGICAILMPIIAACSAAGGTDYRYPLIFRFVK